MRQLVGLLMLWAVLAISSGCSNGPRVEVCLSDGDLNRRALDCTDKTDSGQEITYSLTVESAANFICLSPNHMETVLKGCFERRPAIVDICLINPIGAMDCANNTREWTMTWDTTQGYICTSPNSFQRLIQWCLRR